MHQDSEGTSSSAQTTLPSSASCTPQAALSALTRGKPAAADVVEAGTPLLRPTTGPIAHPDDDPSALHGDGDADRGAAGPDGVGHEFADHEFQVVAEWLWRRAGQ